MTLRRFLALLPCCWPARALCLRRSAGPRADRRSPCRPFPAARPAKNPQQVANTLQILLLLTVLTLAPALLIMTTAFTRIVIVLSFLRSALGTQNIPPNQVLLGLALFLTFFVMAPTFNQMNADAIQPYL